MGEYYYNLGSQFWLFDYVSEYNNVGKYNIMGNVNFENGGNYIKAWDVVFLPRELVDGIELVKREEL